MASIIESFKRVWKSPNILPVFVGYLLVQAVFTVLTNGVPKEYLTTTSILCVALSVILFFPWLWGFHLQLSHNSFAEDFRLPDFNLTPFLTGFKAIPLGIVWFIYFILIYIAVTIPLFIILVILAVLTKLFGTAGLVLFILGIVALMLFIIVLEFSCFFVFVAYTRTFSTKGLWNILLPFKFMKIFTKDIIVLILKCIPIFLIPMGIMTLAVFLLNPQDYPKLSPYFPQIPMIWTYAMLLLATFAMIIPCWTVYNYFVEIYKEKSEVVSKLLP